MLHSALFSQDIVHLKLRLGKKNDTTIVHPFHGPIAGNLALSGMTGAQTPDIELIGLISEVLYVVELAPPMHNTCGKLIYFLKKYQNHIQSSQERMPFFYERNGKRASGCMELNLC